MANGFAARNLPDKYNMTLHLLRKDLVLKGIFVSTVANDSQVNLHATVNQKLHCGNEHIRSFIHLGERADKSQLPD